MPRPSHHAVIVIEHRSNSDATRRQKRQRPSRLIPGTEAHAVKIEGWQEWHSYLLFYALPILVPLAVSGLLLMICMWLFRRFGKSNLWAAGGTVAAVMCVVGIVWGLCRLR